MNEGLLGLEALGYPERSGSAGSRPERTERRVPLRFRVAVIYHQHKDEATRPTYHGYTCELSPSGLSVIVDHNVFCVDDVTVLLALPPEHHGVPTKIVEATAKMVYTVYSPDHDAFRIGMSFRDFKRGGPQELIGYVERRGIKYDYV